MSVTLPLYLYADIEALPSQDPAVRAEIDAKHVVPPLDLDGIKPASNIKNPELIAADIEKRRARAIEDLAAAVEKAAAAAEEEYRRTCLDATTGHIACISFALGDGTVENFANDELYGYAAGSEPSFDVVCRGERFMLREFFTAVERLVIAWAEQAAQSEWESRNPRVAPNPDYWHIDGLSGGFHAVRDKRMWLAEAADGYRRVPTVVAHHAQFDVRYIWQRAVILGVPVPSWWPIDAKPWDSDRIDDTMLAWAGARGTAGLDRLCRALGIPGKPADIDGSKVWDAVREGRIDDVCLYCDADIERQRAVHRRIRRITTITAEVRMDAGTIVSGGRPWDPAAAEDADGMFEAASAAADAQHGDAENDLPPFLDSDPYYSRGFTAHGGRFYGGEP